MAYEWTCAREITTDQCDFELRFPESYNELDQDEEWCELNWDGLWRRIRFHDYHEIYTVPGLYETIFYRLLRCNSPKRVAGLLNDVLSERDKGINGLKVLDVGAGNGMVGEELLNLGVRKVVGIDIISQAKDATYRDRPWVYDDYIVANLCDLHERKEEQIREQNLNCLACVAALGYGDIPTRAFTMAMDMVDTPAWLAFNIKEDFLYADDSTGFCRLIHEMSKRRLIRIEAYQRYQHRLSIGGKPLHYVAMVARKLKDVPDEFLN